MRVYVCVCMYYVYTYVRTYVSTYVIFACVCVCLYVCMYVCLYVCNVCMYVYALYIFILENFWTKFGLKLLFGIPSI
jgi:hypothetical protein